MKQIMIFTLISILAAVAPLIAQEPILSFTLRPKTVTLSPGAEAPAQLVVTNGSIYEADDLEILIEDGQNLAVQPSRPLIKKVAPFTEQEISFSLSVPPEFPLGRYTLSLKAVYTYCIEVSCFQIIEELTLPVNVEAKGISTSGSVKTPTTLWRWLGPVLAALAFTGAVFTRWVFGKNLPLFLALILVSAGSLIYGVIQGQQEQAKGIASVLCTSCVGIDEAPHRSPQLSSTARALLPNLEQTIELLVFYAPWCHSCPYAEAMVEAMAAITSHLNYQLIDVEDQPERAIEHGVIRSGRTVVPALVRVDTGEVVFGVENLETRLLQLLGVKE